MTISEEHHSYLSKLHCRGFRTVGQYQEFHDLIPDGILGPVTKRSLDQLRFCAFDNVLSVRANNGGLCKWDKTNITWTVDPTYSLNGIGTVDIIEMAIWAFDQWSKVCNLNCIYVNYDPNIVPPDITITIGNIDGPSNTLAWSELPCPNRPLKQKYDRDEPFVFSQNPPRNKIDLGRVMCHEIGHAIGIPHLPMRLNALMSPIYSPDVGKPTKADITEAVNRYGKPISVPDVPDEPNNDEFIHIKLPKKWVVGG